MELITLEHIPRCVALLMLILQLANCNLYHPAHIFNLLCHFHIFIDFPSVSFTLAIFAVLVFIAITVPSASPNKVPLPPFSNVS